MSYIIKICIDLIIWFCSYRKNDDVNDEITSNDKRVWEEDDDDQSDLNIKRTRTDLLTETNSGR